MEVLALTVNRHLRLHGAVSVQEDQPKLTGIVLYTIKRIGGFGAHYNVRYAVPIEITRWRDRLTKLITRFDKARKATLFETDFLARAGRAIGVHE